MKDLIIGFLVGIIVATFFWAWITYVEKAKESEEL